MAQDLEPLPDSTYPAGWPIGDSDASGTDYEAQELLHKPHAFALMHGDKGAKIAYGQLHWRVDCFTMVYLTDKIEVTVEDHDSHYHNHSHTHTTTSQSTDYTAAEISHTTTDEDTHGGHGGGYSDDTHTHEIPPHTHPNVHTHGTGDADPVKTSDDISNVTTYSNRQHTVKLPTITYCNQSSQEAMANLESTIPKVKEKNGEAMNPKWGDKKYHELDEYGTVYLVWQVDTEQAGSEVIACWVQVGKPADTSTVGAIGAGNSDTKRRDEDEPHLGTGEPEGEEGNDDKGIFFIEIGTVTKGDHVEQKVSSDVNWTATVMDRVLNVASDEPPTGTYTAP